MRGRHGVLAVALGAWLTVVVSWVSNDPRLSESYGLFSSYNTSPGGLSQAYGYLTARRGKSNVRRLVRDIAEEQPPNAATIFKIGMEDIPAVVRVEREKKKSEKAKHGKHEPDGPVRRTPASLLDDDEEAWVHGGGRMVIALTGQYAGLKATTEPCTPFRRVFPMDPPLPRFETPHCRSFTGPTLSRFHSLLINDRGPVMARWQAGAGEVLAFSMPEVLANEYLGRAGNLELLERLARSAGPVYFDERSHGFKRDGSIWNLLVGDWRLGPAMVFLALAALASFWRRAGTGGTPERPDLDARSEAVDLVQSLGQLYDRSVDRDEALRLYYQGLIRAVHARTGLSGERLDHLVRKETQGYDPRPRYKDLSREEFQRMLAILNHAYEKVGYAGTR